MGQAALTWRDEWRDFVAFCFRPRFAPRCRRVQPHAGWLLDWLPGMSWQRMLAWAGILWVINLFLFGPLVVSVAQQAGATHRVDPHNLPWLLALIWAPLVEEMLFRFGLRRPGIALWLVPLMVLALWQGPGFFQAAIFLVGAWLVMRATRQTHVPGPSARVWLRLYRYYFGWVLHLSVLAFAFLHIHNFTATDLSWWMYPVLVLPQWFTGLVLAWLRVMRGIGAAILLHALFNAGPLMLAWLLLQAIPQPVPG